MEYWIVGHSDWIRHIVKLSNEQIISCSDDKTIKIWNTNTNKCLETIEAHSDAIYHLDKLSSELIASCSGDKSI